mmetsp:Transcript_27309/g.65445  ORF Transcript_27309/g.65445 Transcript_27309/m.65445 type:complete len:812 (-) Transcript_27309:377-2812(-)
MMNLEGFMTSTASNMEDVCNNVVGGATNGTAQRTGAGRDGADGPTSGAAALVSDSDYRVGYRYSDGNINTNGNNDADAEYNVYGDDTNNVDQDGQQQRRSRRDERRAYYDQYSDHHRSSNNHRSSNRLSKGQRSAPGMMRIGMDGSLSNSSDSGHNSSGSFDDSSGNIVADRRNFNHHDEDKDRLDNYNSLYDRSVVTKTTTAEKARSSSVSSSRNRRSSWTGTFCCLLCVAVVAAAVGVGVYYAYTNIKANKDAETARTFAGLNSSPATTGMWEDATCPTVGQIFDKQKPQLSIKMAGFSTTVDDDTKKKELEQAVQDGYNLLTQMGCNDNLYNRWIYDVKIISQEVVEDVELVQDGGDTSGFSNIEVEFESDPALLVVFETDISCMGCSATDAFSSYYPTTFGGITDENDSSGGTRRLQHFLETKVEVDQTANEDIATVNQDEGQYHSQHSPRLARTGRAGIKTRGSTAAISKTRGLKGSTDVVDAETLPDGASQIRALPQPLAETDSFDAVDSSLHQDQEFVQRRLADLMNAATVIENIEEQVKRVLDVDYFSEVTITSSTTGDSAGTSVANLRKKGKGKGGKGKESLAPSLSPAPTSTPMPTTKSGKTGAKKKGGSKKGKKGKKSEAPSQAPSFSASPSLTPSSQPSDIPSVSIAPSLSPSAIPSVEPSATPSALPSLAPSASPSSMPSLVPSALPSEVPSMMPSIQLLAVTGPVGFLLEEASNQGLCVVIDPTLTAAVVEANCLVSSTNGNGILVTLESADQFCCGAFFDREGISTVCTATTATVPPTGNIVAVDQDGRFLCPTAP